MVNLWHYPKHQDFWLETSSIQSPNLHVLLHSEFLELFLLLVTVNTRSFKYNFVPLIVRQRNEIFRRTRMTYSSKPVNLNPSWFLVSTNIKHGDFKVVANPRGARRRNALICWLSIGRCGQIHPGPYWNLNTALGFIMPDLNLYCFTLKESKYPKQCQNGPQALCSTHP